MSEETVKVMHVHVPKDAFTFKLYITLCGKKNRPDVFKNYMARSLRYTCSYYHTFKLFETREAFFIYHEGIAVKTFALFKDANAWIIDKCVEYMQSKYLGNLHRNFDTLPVTLNYIK